MRKNIIYLVLILVLSALFLVYLMGYQRQIDKQPPTISFSEGLLELSAQDPSEALLQGASAHDNVDADVTDSLVVASVKLSDPDGTIDVTYAAFDKAGNVAKAVRTAKYTDYRSPRFSLNRSLTFAQNTLVDIFDIVSAADARDGDISSRIRITSLDGASDSDIGTHQVELRVSNDLGETVSLTVPVEVYATGTYAATLTLTDYLVYLPAGRNLDVAKYLDEYKRGNTTIALQDPLPKNCSVDVKNNVLPGVPGVYTVEYRVTQTVGMEPNAQKHTGYAKLIVVVEG